MSNTELKPCPFCGGKAVVKAITKMLDLQFGVNVKIATQE